MNEADCLFCTLCVRREDVVAETLEESAEVMLNAILLRVVLFLCARADENSRGKEVTRRERHKKGLLMTHAPPQ